MFMLLVDECPENIHVQLSGAVQETFDWDSRNYTKASASVNGRSYWVHKSSAIWWMKGRWRIGLLTNLGSNVQGQRTIPAYSGVCPTSHGSIWLYWDSKKTREWIETGVDTTLTPLGTINIYYITKYRL